MHDLWPNFKYKMRRPAQQLIHNSLPKLTILTDTPYNSKTERYQNKK
jgi:hypothetical protein